MSINFVLLSSLLILIVQDSSNEASVIFIILNTCWRYKRWNRIWKQYKQRSSNSSFSNMAGCNFPNLLIITNITNFNQFENNLSFNFWIVHCVKSVQIRSFFWSVFFRIRTEYRKRRTRKNSPFGHFSRSGCEIYHCRFRQSRHEDFQ